MDFFRFELNDAGHNLILILIILAGISVGWSILKIFGGILVAFLMGIWEFLQSLKPSYIIIGLLVVVIAILLFK